MIVCILKSLVSPDKVASDDPGRVVPTEAVPFAQLRFKNPSPIQCSGVGVGIDTHVFTGGNSKSVETR